MPTLSASDYTTFLKFKAAAATPIGRAIQTRDNATLSQSVLNANILASQAAFVTQPPNIISTLQGSAVTNAATTIVTAARTDVITAAAAGTNVIQYTTSQAHGLTTGDVITITGMVTGTLSVTPNQSAKAVTVTGATTFTIASTGVTGSAGVGNGSITGRVYYTTSIANGLLAGDTISITGITTFTASAATVLAVPTTTTFVLSSSTTGTAVSGQTGSITGLVYYTTASAHGIVGTPIVTIAGLTGTPAFNQTATPVYRTASTTIFILQSSATGTAITGASGQWYIVTYPNSFVSVQGLARVVGRQVVQTRSNPDALSTLSWTSGTSGSVGSLSSSRNNVPGGLPTGFKNSQGTYTRIPQNAGWVQGGAGTVSSGPKRF